MSGGRRRQQKTYTNRKVDISSLAEMLMSGISSEKFEIIKCFFQGFLGCSVQTSTQLSEKQAVGEAETTPTTTDTKTRGVRYNPLKLKL